MVRNPSSPPTLIQLVVAFTYVCLGSATAPVDEFVDWTAHKLLSSPSRVGEEAVSTRMRERLVEREVRLDRGDG